MTSTGPSFSGIRVTRTDAPFKTQRRVISALIVRMLQTRFGGSTLAYAIAVLWPVAHTLVILFVYTLVGREASFGTDSIIWIMSGCLPYVLLLYPSRVISVCIIDNSGLLTFPIVTRLDILISAIVLEILTATCVVIVTAILIAVYGKSFDSFNFSICVAALLLSVYLGIGFGVLFSPIMQWNARIGGLTGFILLLVWVLGGIFYLPDSIPEPFRWYLSWNPFVHAAELFREGIFEDYSSHTLDVFYLCAFPTVSVAIGLLAQRLIYLR